jgi:hypothetical protein
LIQISAPISPGSSGGPVVDKSANLVGVSIGGISDGQNLNFAIPAIYVKKLIENKSQLNFFNISKPQTPEALYDDIREGVIIQDIITSYLDIGDGLPKNLESFSIRNNLSFPVEKIKLLFIVYNKQGIPTDSHEDTFCEYTNPIRPHLAYREILNRGDIQPIKVTENWEIRVLDFEIVK